jgi:hypothetical protein
MTAVTVDVSPAEHQGLRGPVPARTAGPAAADRSPTTARPARAVRSWPLLILAAPAAAEVWSGWVGIAQKTGFGLVSPLPGIWPSLHLDTSITLPVGVEAYAACALRAWLASEHAVSGRTRRFAKWSAIFSFALGMGGQVAYHLLPRPTRHGHRGLSPPSCPACRSWSWLWGPRWPTCCAVTPQLRTGRLVEPRSQPPHGPRTGPPRTSTQADRTTIGRPGPRPGPVIPRGRVSLSWRTAQQRPVAPRTRSSILRTRRRSRHTA